MSLPLHMACSTGKREAVKKIIDSVHQHVLEIKNESGKTPLMLSVIHNQIECASLLLKAGVTVNNSDSLGQTALHMAVNKGFHRCVRLLLSYNAFSQQKDFFGVTPLHLAAIQQNSKCLFALLKDIKPGEIDIQDTTNKTALHYSAAYSMIENTRNLLLKDANINIPDDEGKTPLHWAATNPSVDSVECVKILLEKESSLINWQDYEGRSPLHLAVSSGSVEVVRFLVCQDDCIIDSLDNAFCTPLHRAAEKGFHEAVDVLLSAGASFTSADDYGATPLHYAACNNHAKTIGMFLSRYYISISLEDANGRNAFLWAAASNAVDVVRIMCANGMSYKTYADKDGITALHAAAFEGQEETVELLLNLQVPVDVKDKYKMTPLMRASESGRCKTVQLLISLGANIHERDINNRSCLHWCSIGGHAYLAQLLILKGVECNDQDDFGMTPLHYACMKNGFLNCVSIFLQSKAKLDYFNTEGKTPLHMAVLNEHFAIVKLLCSYDADVNAITIQSYWATALDFAVMNNSMKMVNLLRQYGALRLNEIEEIAALKIKDYYFTKKKSKLIMQNKNLEAVEDACLEKSIFDMETNSALLKRCQHIIEAFRFPHDKDEFCEDFPKNFFSTEMPKFQTESLESLEKSVFIIGIEMKSASIIQRAWKKYTLKNKFKKMRQKIERFYETEEQRFFAENLWQQKLNSFYEQ